VHNSRRCPIPGTIKNKGKYTMDQAETIRFDELCQRHLRLLKLQGESQKTIDAYS
jgi:hypothetical protein